MKYIRNFAEHTNYEAEMSKIPTPSVSYCRKENECHFMPNNVIMFKVGDLNGNTNQTVRVYYYEGGSETIQIIEGNRWYVVNVPSGKSLKNLKGIIEITDTIISAKIKVFGSSILEGYYGNVRFVACDFSDITNMRNMFYNIGTITSLDVFILDTSNVTDMSSMFQSCIGLKTLDVSNWDVSKVTTMSRMFNGCTSLQSLDLSNWNVANVTNMDVMFGDCSSLQTLDVSNFDTSNVTSMNFMFYKCSSLQTLNLNGWDMTKVTNMVNMFYNCGKLNTIYMRGCNQTTIDKIKSCVSNNVTIITE